MTALGDAPVSCEDIAWVVNLLRAWGAWANNDGSGLQPTAAYLVLNIVIVLDGEPLLRLSDDVLVLIDQGVLQLIPRYRQIAEIEYRHHRGASQTRNAERIGLKRTAYCDRLLGAHQSMHRILKDRIDIRRQKRA